jgi:hypothetical protein
MERTMAQETERDKHEVAIIEPLSAAVMEKVLVGGDLSKLTSDERVRYYGRTCESLGLNPLTKPFEYITLNGKLTLYAKRDATDQLRSLRKVSITIVGREKVGDVYAVTARASTPDGRQDESIGAVATANLKGDALANALMKAETKAKRRVTLSIVGLGWLDESEIETIPGAKIGESAPVKLGLVDASEVEALPADLPLLDQGESVAREGMVALVAWWKELSLPDQKALRSHKDRLKEIAEKIDSAGGEV